MTNWQEIDPIFQNFTSELQTEWESYGFTAEKTKPWLSIGLQVYEAGFAYYLEQRSYVSDRPFADGVLEQLRLEYNDIVFTQFFNFNQEVIQNNYIYPSLNQVFFTTNQIPHFSQELTVTPNINQQVITETDSPAQQWLNEHYPRATRAEIKELNISDKELTGSLTLVGFSNLTRLYCHNNNLTELDVSNCVSLTELRCYNNNFPTQDCRIFSKLLNLEILWIGNINQTRIQTNIYNRFTGSLAPLQQLTKLENLDISNTWY